MWAAFLSKQSVGFWNLISTRFFRGLSKSRTQHNLDAIVTAVFLLNSKIVRKMVSMNAKLATLAFIWLLITCALWTSVLVKTDSLRLDYQIVWNTILFIAKSVFQAIIKSQNQTMAVTSECTARDVLLGALGTIAQRVVCKTFADVKTE